jgi:hypothetical protein
MAVLYLLAGGSLLAQPAGERAKSDQQAPGEISARESSTPGENRPNEPARLIQQTIQPRDTEHQPALSNTGDAARAAEAQSALEFETVTTGGPENRARRPRPNRPKLAATTANAQPPSDHGQLTTDN